MVLVFDWLHIKDDTKIEVLQESSKYFQYYKISIKFNV
ncbi:hypothetical protein ADIWIN_2937 [Winogradskyella psychrotolerans RS-3]|uniref:Uncharacterized protein n=1 Tax=Winogradskyella psychrotolerans RS-3 TaxID=641526 RepID=S7X7T0_9FLAO|nr:hypothetical protein ADIWIN_2937 [Winogradskyella psychrotolerans RS-3]